MNPMSQFDGPRPLGSEHADVHSQLGQPPDVNLGGIHHQPPHTGWKLVLGYDGNGNEVAADGVFRPPCGIRRLLRWLLLGEYWVKTR